MSVDEIFRRVVKLIWWRSKLSIEEEMLIWSWAQNYHWRRRSEKKKRRRRRRKDADLIIDSELSNWRKVWSWFDETQSFRLKKRCWFDHWAQSYRIVEKEKEKVRMTVDQSYVKLSLKILIECRSIRLMCFYSIH